MAVHTHREYSFEAFKYSLLVELPYFGTTLIWPIAKFCNCKKIGLKTKPKASYTNDCDSRRLNCSLCIFAYCAYVCNTYWTYYVSMAYVSLYVYNPLGNKFALLSVGVARIESFERRDISSCRWNWGLNYIICGLQLYTVLPKKVILTVIMKITGVNSRRFFKL